MQENPSNLGQARIQVPHTKYLKPTRHRDPQNSLGGRDSSWNILFCNELNGFPLDICYQKGTHWSLLFLKILQYSHL